MSLYVSLPEASHPFLDLASLLFDLAQDAFVLVRPGELGITKRDKVFILLPKVVILKLALEASTLKENRAVGAVHRIEDVLDLSEQLNLLFSQVRFPQELVKGCLLS